MYKIKNKKCLPTHQFCRRIKSISVIGITVFGLSLTVVNSGIAATLDTDETRDIPQTATTTLKKNSSDQIQEFIDDVSSFVRGDFFGSITHLSKNASGSVEIPDLGQVFSKIMKGSLP